MTPQTNNDAPEILFDEKTQIKTSAKVFDVSTKEFVEVVKVAARRSVTDMKQFVELMENDAAAILAIINDGLVAYDQKSLAKDSAAPMYTEQEDGTLDPFAGEVLPESATAKLKASQLSLAKNLFGFAKSMTPESKKAAKEKALNMLLSAPGALDLLKAQ